MITIRNISKRFKDKKAVDDVSFSVSEGEIFGIVGPDGAGKSTILRMLSTILKPDGGTIEYHGEDIFTIPYAIKDRLSYMPQRFGLYEDLTVDENINFFGKLFNLPKKQIMRRKVELYEFSRLEPYRDRMAGKLSGGMKQKLGLTCCLVHKPDVLLLDEPTNGVDPVSRREFWQILYRLLAEGIAIIVTTAYLDEAERCNRIGMLYEGRMIQIDSPYAIKKSITKYVLDIRSPENRRLERELRAGRDMPPFMRTGESLHCFTDERARVIKRITETGKKHGISPVHVKSIEPTLEDVFIDIVMSRGNK